MRFWLYAEQLAAEERDRRAWVNELAARWQLVRLPDSLTLDELAAQQEMIITLRREQVSDRLMIGSFLCPVCGLTSFHPGDVATGYCGKCHQFTAPLDGY